jgi:hypothetical protein
MSVYNQLDEYRSSAILPMGRVNPRDAETGYIYIVGADDSGNLVKARTERESRLERAIADTVRDMADHLLTIKAATREPSHIREGCQCVTWRIYGNRWGSILNDLGEYREDTRRGILERLALIIRERVEWKFYMALEWQSLPLIVLAGLR